MDNTIREFETGSRRGNPAGKGRMDLLPAESVLNIYTAVTETETSTEPHTYVEYLKEALVSAMKYMSNGSKYSLVIAARAACIAVGIYESIHGDNEDDKADPSDTEGCLAFGLKQVSIHYEEGASKYGENNWKLGQPISVFLDSGLRHTIKAIAGITDEHHPRAAAWNFMCAIWTLKYKPEMNNIVCD